MPPLARLLGYAGLLPHIAVVLVLLERNSELRFSALALGYAYAVIILSFLGGMWWGLAARASPVPGQAPGWIWIAAVTPSLIALGSAVPWATGDAWPGPSLIMVGAALLVSPVVDWRLAHGGLVPDWWLRLRIPLSFALGTMTIAMALL
ncbi:MAG: DUF3429 domain-containing protein [Sphingomonas sp.]|nr:DUF3429 domain-containing protein [Sphingomonas sp.]